MYILAQIIQMCLYTHIAYATSDYVFELQELIPPVQVQQMIDPGLTMKVDILTFQYRHMSPRIVASVRRVEPNNGQEPYPRITNINVLSGDSDLQGLLSGDVGLTGVISEFNFLRQLLLAEATWHANGFLIEWKSLELNVSANLLEDAIMMLQCTTRNGLSLVTLPDTLTKVVPIHAENYHIRPKVSVGSQYSPMGT